MPSPRASPALRPTSPLSPRFEPTPRYEALQPPSPRGLHPRSAATAPQIRHHTSAASTLKLPGLPRFHPANFPSSQYSSAANTPGTLPNSGHPSPNPPVSPKAQQRLYSEAQKQLLFYHRETLAAQAAVAAATASSSTARPTSSRYEKPLSPRLAPLGSPGPVTPLELEGHEGYLLAGAHASSAAAHAAAAQAAAKQLSAQNSELVEKLIQQEVRRSSDLDRATHELGR